jgi:FkbM family methyltransferase
LLTLSLTVIYDNINRSGHSSVVERLVANEKVEGSTPFARSKNIILNIITNLFQKYITNKDIRNFKNNFLYYILFRIVRKFIVKDLIVQIYNFKVFASNKKNKTSNALLRKCHFDDQAELKILKKISDKKKIYFLDCGSNYGFYSLFVANENLSNKVIAIEASKTTVEELNKNINLNSQKNIKIYNNALSDIDDKKLLFNQSDNDWESSLVHKNFKVIKQEEVLTKKIDTITGEISDLEQYNLIIKLDIEGNEFKALAGAFMTIEKYSPIIIIEFSKFIFNEKNSRIFLNQFLNKFNYEIFNTKLNKINESDIYDLIDQLDIKHDTIGNYFLVKENSDNYKYFTDG